jgi:Fructose-bisphosphate aldolase class-I
MSRKSETVAVLATAAVASAVWALSERYLRKKPVAVSSEIDKVYEEAPTAKHLLEALALAQALTDEQKAELEATAQQLTAAGKGVLAADESVSTIGKRLTKAGLVNDYETRRAYREVYPMWHCNDSSHANCKSNARDLPASAVTSCQHRLLALYYTSLDVHDLSMHIPSNQHH